MSDLLSYMAFERGRWGRPCLACGHPSSYHGVTFCKVNAGAAAKRACDCAGYQNPERPVVAAVSPVRRPYDPGVETEQ
jgi:hypothetical protein